MNKIDKRVIELINEFNNTVKTYKDSKDTDSSIFIKFYLKDVDDD